MKKINTGFDTKEEAAELGYTAATIERLSDGSVLTLNSDLTTYSYPNSRNKYTYERLMEDDRCRGDFQVLSWVKNLNVEKFLKFLNK